MVNLPNCFYCQQVSRSPDQFRHVPSVELMPYMRVFAQKARRGALTLIMVSAGQGLGESVGLLQGALGLTLHSL